MKKLVTVLFTAFGLLTGVFSLDLTLSFTPGVSIPLHDDSGVGFGGFAQADLDLFGFLNVGAEGHLSINPLKPINANNVFYGGSLNLGAYYYPLSRLYIGAGGSFGLWQVSTSADVDEPVASDFYRRGYGEIGFRVSPELTLTASGSYNTYMGLPETENYMNSVQAGIGVRYTMPIGKKGSSSFITTLNQGDAAFPVFMSAYRACPFGVVTIRNNEGAEVRNVKVYFRAGKYTASAYESASISKIKKYGSVEVPLYADFSKEILKFVEDGKISGEIVIEYEFLGKKKQAVQNAVISVNNRNAFSWTDSTALSCYISPDTPEILEFAKFVAGVARNNFYTGMNRNLQMAAAMTEAIRLTGIKYSDDKLTPYAQYHTGEELDSIQYPLQTLKMLSGDYDEMGILLASCLESVGVATGYVTLPDDFIVLVSAGIRPGTEGNSFGNTDGLIVDDSSVFFGISMASLHRGFTRARSDAAKKIAAALADEEYNFEYTNVHDAWQVYLPCAFNEANGSYDKPSNSSITSAFTAAVNDYINTDLTTVLARARKSADSNKIGVALMRMGRYADAKAEFNKSASTSALNNLATVYMIEKNYTSAASTYKRVLAKDPDNKIATKGLENANAKLGL